MKLVNLISKLIKVNNSIKKNIELKRLYYFLANLGPRQTNDSTSCPRENLFRLFKVL